MQYANAAPLIVVVDGISTFCRLKQSSNAHSFIVVTDNGMLIDSRLSHDLNAPFSFVFMVFGMLIVLSFVHQQLNASLGMMEMDYGRVMLSRLTQAANAALPIVVTDEGMLMLWRRLQPLNA